MPLRLIAEEQIESVEWGGATFAVQVRAGPWWEALRAKHTQGGVQDWDSFQAEAIAGFLKGWESLQDASGAPLDFTPESVPTVYAALPEDCTEALWRVARGRHLKYEGVLGN